MEEKKNEKNKKKDLSSQEQKEELQKSYDLGVKYMEDLEEKEKR